MSSSQDSPTPGVPSAVLDRLDSWKEVAAYLKRDVRTVQRWEKRHGLPVHRLVNSERGPIYAFKSELDIWWREHSAYVEGLAGEADSADREVAAEESPSKEDSAASAHSAPQRPKWMPVAALVAVVVTAAATIYWLAAGRRAPIVASPRPEVLRLLVDATSEGREPDTIAVGKQPGQALLSPDERELFVLNHGDKSVSIIDTGERKVIVEIPVGHEPKSMALSPDGKWLYVATSTAGLVIIETTTRATSVVPTGEVSSIALSPDGRWLFMAQVHEGLAKLDTESRKVTKIAALECPYAVALSPDGTRLYVNYQCSGPGGKPGRDVIEVFDTRSGNVIRTWNQEHELPNVGIHITAAPDGAFVWAAGGGCGKDFTDHRGCAGEDVINFHVFRTADNAFVYTKAFPRDFGFNDVSFIPGDNQLLFGGDSLGVVDPVTHSVVERLPMSASARVAFTKDGTRAYVPLPSENQVAILRSTSKSCSPSATPQAWWPADGTAADIKSSDTGALSGGAGYAAGKIGQAFALPGNGAKVTLTNPRSVFGGAFTVAMWLKMDSVDDRRETSILHRMALNGPNINGFRLYITASGKVAFCIGGASGDGCGSQSPLSVEAVQALQPNTWTHIAALKDGENVALYIDGVRQPATTSRAVAGQPVDPERDKSPAEVQLGAALGKSSSFRGKVDELQVFSQALTGQQISQLHQWNACLSRK